MKNIVKVLSVFFFAAMAVVGCEKPVAEEPVKIRLNKEMISNLPVGETQKLLATVTPEGTKVTIVWSSDNTKIAEVNQEGVVVGVAPGTAVITAQAEDAVATCKVIVTSAQTVKPTKISLNPSSVKLEKGETQEIEVLAEPSNAVIGDLEWMTTNDKVATVKDGVITAVGVGNASITARCESYREIAAICQVEVVEPQGGGEDPDTPVDPNPNPDPGPDPGTDPDPDPNPDPNPENPGLKSVTVYAENDATDLQVGLQVKLKAAFNPADYQPESVSWVVTENDKYAEVDKNGVVTGLEAGKEADNTWGKCVVTLYVDGVSGYTTLRVIPRQPESIEVDLPDEGYIRVGEEWDFNPRVLPEGLGFGVTSSITKPGNKFTSDSKLSSDLPGTIAAQFAVSAHTDLVYTSYRKNVTLNVIPYWVETLTLPVEQEMEVGGSIILSPEFTSDVDGVQPTDKALVWTSSDESKAVVDNNGKVTALAAGTVEIIATTSGGWSVPSGQSHKSATCTVTISEPETVVNVGDFYYSDGTTSSTLQAGKTVIGVVISRDNATSTDKKLPSGCTHGVVLALGEAAGNWSSSYDAGSVSSWATQNGYENTTGVYYSNEEWAYKRNEYGNKLLGYNNTKALKAYIKNNGYTSGIIEALDAYEIALPATASELYIPSIAEMDAIFKNLSVINAALKEAGGSEFVIDRTDLQLNAYWTVSENEASGAQAATVNPFSGELHGGVMKSKEKKVRFIFAF